MSFPDLGKLKVLVSGEPIGELESVGGGRTRFVPSTNGVAAGQHPPLGFSFLVSSEVRWATGAAPVWFENLLPERGSRLRQWICRQRGIRETSSLALLAALGRDLPGAVEVVGDTPEDPIGELSGSEDSELRFSLAGMQLKLSMLLSGDRFVFPARGQSGAWIVKIPGERFQDLPEVEAATMRWAQETGLVVPDFHILPIERLSGVDAALLGEPRSAFAIRRFDRQAEGRVHQEDFAQALEFRPDNKYGDQQPGATYDSLARLVSDLCHEKDRLEYIARLAFVVASGNDDAHLKNWSFQWSYEHRPWLSPCYDMVATVSWPEFGWDRKIAPHLSLSLGKEKSFAELDRRCLEKFAQRSGQSDAVDLFMHSLERARLAWESVAERAPQRMVDGIVRHWSQVPLLRSIGSLRK